MPFILLINKERYMIMGEINNKDMGKNKKNTINIY